MSTINKENVKQLNSFLRGELSAVETYRQCLEKLDGEPAIRRQLQECQQSHASRAELLRQEIRAQGGDPAEDSGPWGTFAKLVEGGAKLFGEKAAIAALEEGEDHGRNDYERDVNEVSGPVRAFVESRLIPEQRRTHDVVSNLKQSL